MTEQKMFNDPLIDGHEDQAEFYAEIQAEADDGLPYVPTREDLEKMYEDATGLDARRGVGRIDHLEAWVKEHYLEDFTVFNDTDKIGRDWANGIRWYAGAQYGDTICLGYTSARGAFIYKNAIFAQSDEVYLGE